MLATKYSDLSVNEKIKQDFTTIDKNEPIKLNKYVKRRLIVFSIISGIIFINGGAILHSQSKDLHKKEKEYASLKRELTQLKEEEEKLENEVMKLETNEYIEQIARRDYFLSREGEIIFQIADKK